MSLMDFLNDFVTGPLNLIDHAEWLFKGAFYGDLGYKFVIPRADKGGAYNLNEVEQMLKTYGVSVYGRSHDSKNMYFHVKKRQARWAEYLMLHAGVELHNPPVDNRNAGYVATHAPGWMPTPWSERREDHQDQQVSNRKDTQPQGIKSVLDWLNQF